jgi:IclR family KDG regulon transcriptional repressor
MSTISRFPEGYDIKFQSWTGRPALSQLVRAVERALDILSCFTRDEPTHSLSQIAERVGMSKSTVHRMLGTLESKRFISRDKVTGFYRLGFRFVEMASLIDRNVQQWSQPYLQHLLAECGETVDLSVLDGSSLVYLHVIESPQRVKIAAAVGQRLPAFCTASGKALMAYLPENEIKKIIGKGLHKYTENTAMTPEAILNDLRLTRERGFAISEGEYEKDINAVAAPILTDAQYPIAAIAVAGPSYRLTRERMLMLGQTVQATADAIAHEVGPAALSCIIAQAAT